MLETRSILTLGELQGRIKNVLGENFFAEVWVRAEISECKRNASGHCYLTLVEKDENSQALTAKASAVIWKRTFAALSAEFVAQTGRELSAGLTVLVRAQVQFSELYGLTLVVTAIDGAFSLGALEQQRLRTIKRLESEGLLGVNAMLELPTLPRRLAVISSATAAGYRDFVKQLSANEFGFKFSLELFEAMMQGTTAPKSMVSALDEIARREADFDAVLIMRGGGGAMDLVCFDDYELSACIAQFPLPVLTGIGHDHDHHIADMVAHTAVKTPTALADFLIERFAQEEFQILSLAQRLHLAVKGKFHKENARIETFFLRLKNGVGRQFLEQNRRLDVLETRLNAADPRKVIAKGFALPSKGGKRVKSASELNAGDELKLLFADGEVSVTVN